MKLSSEQRHGVVILTLLIVVVALLRGLFADKEVVTEVAQQHVQEVKLEPKTPIPTPFDPNTVELEQLLQMGVDRSAAVSLLRYRAGGKVFRIKEEVIECYGFSDSLYFALEPYITIGEEYRPKPRVKTAPQPIKQERRVEPKREPLKLSAFRIDTLSVAYLVETATMSRRQAEVFLKWRDMSGIYSIDELRECYVVDDSLATLLDRYIIYQQREVHLADLNHADSVTLVALPGIGAKSAEAIIRYRKLLGGYHSVTQLFEIPIITEQNFSLFHKYFFVNIVDISKIDINFASAEVLSGHPYFTPARVKRLTKKRNTKGGWSSIEEMIEDNIFNEQEARHVQPYLIFTPIESPK